MGSGVQVRSGKGKHFIVPAILSPNLRRSALTSFTFSRRYWRYSSVSATSILKAPGRFAPKPAPPGTIPPGLFAQNFDVGRFASKQINGSIHPFS